MFDAAFDDWKSSKFGSTASMRCIVKAAAMEKYGVEKKTTASQLRSLIAEKHVVSPPHWFQAMLAQGILLLNASLTTGGPFSATEHEKFWRPVIERIIREIVEAKAGLEQNDNRRALLFLWWGSAAKRMKKRICRILENFCEVPVKHIDWFNPAAQGDKFCDRSPHFVEVNKHMTALGMKAVDWLPTEDWLTSVGATSGAFGEFISNTKELHKMFLERIQNGLELGAILEPITGVRNTQLTSIIEACAPVGLSSAAQLSLNIVKARKTESTLSQDERAAIYLYTGNALYSRLNRALRNADRKKVQCYYSYLLLFLLGHDKLPRARDISELYRGISKDLTSSYSEGKVVTWWGVSSCSSNKDVAQFFAGGGTFFIIKSKTAVPIMDLSAHKSEEEYILAPGTQLEVTRVLKTDDLSQVYMTEVDDERLVG
ncbi:uracil-DNA glycosylase [Gracilaria domingensis]|nr:uracil-DNA glycosylase [Gracilaria domingensis]